MSLHEGSSGRRGALPVIARIVREPAADHGRVRRTGVALAGLLRRTGAGTLVIGALGLATLGSIAGLGMRSLSDGASLASAAPDEPTHVVDATATERLLARAPLAARVDRAGLTSPSATSSLDPSTPSPAPFAAASAPTPASAHALALAGAHAPAASHAPSSHGPAATAHAPSHPAPSHAPRHVAPRAFAAAHTTHAANHKATSTTALARR
jgi:hypothetical protein